jgi:hypothetical protein
MIGTTVAALFLLIRQHLAGGNLALAIAAMMLLGVSVGVVVIGATRFSQAILRTKAHAIAAAGGNS